MPNQWIIQTADGGFIGPFDGGPDAANFLERYRSKISTGMGGVYSLHVLDVPDRFAARADAQSAEVITSPGAG